MIYEKPISKPKMRRAMNNRSLIGRFKNNLSWVALKSGKHYGEYNERGTTRTCHQCQYKVEGGISPAYRHWTCPHCHIINNRDENAAVNGMREYLRNSTIKSGGLSPPVPGSGLVSIKERWAWRVLPSGIFAISRGQGGVFQTQASGN